MKISSHSYFEVSVISTNKNVKTKIPQNALFSFFENFDYSLTIADQVIFNVGKLVDKVSIYTTKDQQWGSVSLVVCGVSAEKARLQHFIRRLVGQHQLTISWLIGNQM